ncbi:hypothetical protein BU26DRAFT_46061 [Trematosphaeria pertusa]|uniref:Uncharacterized protein n=1 Tax=Trematosphaeria pertusa TaxID=390896 RepID=A0A6A6I7W6_9PLEO|nr:uncharacterized protein BU26DRAFT_46061 [Trematosphaeria pertusa]KAF2246461.1 hypothetical protein BU26DRAFT_46061 [Trematosphaeria pertusa]
MLMLPCHPPIANSASSDRLSSQSAHRNTTALDGSRESGTTTFARVKSGKKKPAASTRRHHCGGTAVGPRPGAARKDTDGVVEGVGNVSTTYAKWPAHTAEANWSLNALFAKSSIDGAGICPAILCLPVKHRTPKENSAPSTSESLQHDAGAPHCSPCPVLRESPREPKKQKARRTS